ncbi:NAD(P)-dependent oxidoreductase [Paraburkholderia edwinii]|uniref:NAD(P)-dependent oxidoreductase n=1 Tax=Paraburkholderia edwinii TaxID=2861782 RepID=A0ABX8UG54_9BURK|nr:NAD(P)-dependent oxidoreductase [Paraburkholderia edwinii]QYD67860.1 NAD(P)-dependent oxidoreductase [Paraburkholderia edwinii]
MKVLLTGGAGFIGTNVARKLIGSGVEVVAIGRRPCPIDGVENVVVPRLDLSEFNGVMSRHGVTIVYHLAAAGVHPSDRDLSELVRVNTLLPVDVVTAAKAHGAKAVVLMGSSAEYAAQAVTMLDESMALETQRIYGATKAAGGLVALATGVQHQLPVALLRAFNIYGANEAAHRLLPSLASKLARRESVDLSLGTQVRDFVYVDDACDALVLAAQALIDGRMATGAYNVSTGIGTPVAEFARTVARVLRVDESLLRFGALPLRPDDLPMVVGDPGRIQRATGWRAAYSLEQGITGALERLVLN